MTMAFMGALDTIGGDVLIPVTAVALWGAAVVFSIGFLLVPRAGWTAKSVGLLIAIGAPLFALFGWSFIPALVIGMMGGIGNAGQAAIKNTPGKRQCLYIY